MIKTMLLSRKQVFPSSAKNQKLLTSLMNVHHLHHCSRSYFQPPIRGWRCDCLLLLSRPVFGRFLYAGVCPETRWVEGSNYVDVNVKVDERTHRVIMMGAMDNLVKGAAGQAVQNMNLMFGLPENEGLCMPPMFP